MRVLHVNLEIGSPSKLSPAYRARELLEMSVDNIYVVGKVPFVAVCFSTLFTRVTFSTVGIVKSHVPLQSDLTRKFLST